MSQHLSRRAIILGTTAFAALSAARGAVAAPTLPYKNAGLPVPARVSDLLARMTVAEKIGQLCCIGDHRPLEDGKGLFVATNAAKTFPDGIGHAASIGQYSGRDPDSPQRDPLTMATYINAVQKWAVEGTRLGIPVLCHEEALHGHRAFGATSFPQAIGLSASFDPDLVEQVFSTAAAEMRARGAVMALTPVVDVARDPRWGRVEETYGEDAYLCGQMGLAAVRGFQGRTLPLAKDKVIATLKHFVADAESVNGSNTGPAVIPERTLREVHLRPFETIIKAFPARSVMVTYNEIDGVPCAANPWLLKDVLRGEWGFEGMVIADYDSVKQLCDLHQLAPDHASAAALALNSGVDVEMPQPDTYPMLAAKFDTGAVTLARLDEAVARVLTVKFEADLFETPYVDVRAAAGKVNTPAARALAAVAAGRCPVLLKNDRDTLPLRPEGLKRLLVVGNAAKDTPIGEYSGQPPYVTSLVDGLKTAARGRFEVVYSEGVRITDGHSWYVDTVAWTPDSVNDGLIREAVAAAPGCDAIVMVLGANEEISREAWSKDHMGDRSVLDLMGRQNALAEAMFATGKPVIAILLNGSPLTVNRLAEKADALIEAWYGGQETGTGLAAILLGDVNPGAKLPISIPRSAGQLPVYYNRKPTARRGYIDGTTEPLYPFGHGLSYTTFEISAPRAAPQTPAGQPVTVTVDVANTGSRPGDEVVQIYLHHPFASVTLPVRELKAFRRVSLASGEKQTLSFELPAEAFGYWNSAMHFVTEPGTYELMAGASSVDLKSLTVKLV